MNGLAFALQPFEGEGGPAPAVAVTGHLTRQGGRLGVRFRLSGRLDQVVIPAPAPSPRRRHGLWQGTCCEFFLASAESAGYWEFNLSPAGHWNLYRFAAYRQGMAEEEALTSLPFTLCRAQGPLVLAVTVETGSLIPAGRPLEAGVSAVLQGTDGRLSYWALTHPGPAPDFHRRDGFVIRISG
ncbi:MAG: DOMON-like domain-containing protein [Deltaproteobacteria bacterium]|nr:DOMON-like domain-containing protein [Deltaproteobacteria bacterium]